MNRICKAFDDIGNINMNYAGIAQFNWQMLLSEPCKDSYPEIPELFCQMDSANVISIIESQTIHYANEKQLINGYSIIAEDIISEMVTRYGSLERVYPYIAKYLFGEEGANKAAHKRMFWRIFGEIALRNLKKNLENADTCKDCNMKIPSWVTNHQCIKNTKGFYACIDCGVLCERTNSRQYRCDYCQENYNILKKRMKQRESRKKKGEVKARRISVLQSLSTET